MVFFDLNSEFPFLRGIERQLVFIPTVGYNKITGKDYGRNIVVFNSAENFSTKPYNPETNTTSYSRIWLEGLIINLKGNVEAENITLWVEGECITTELRLPINVKELNSFGSYTPNDFYPYITVHDTIDPANVNISIIYNPDPVLSIQKNLKLVMSIPSSKSDPSIPDLDTVPILYRLGILFKWITNEKDFIESRRELIHELIGRTEKERLVWVWT